MKYSQSEKNFGNNKDRQPRQNKESYNKGDKYYKDKQESYKDRNDSPNDNFKKKSTKNFMFQDSNPFSVLGKK